MSPKHCWGPFSVKYQFSKDAGALGYWHLRAQGPGPASHLGHLLPHTAPASVRPAPCCPLLSHCWNAHRTTSQPRWPLRERGKLSGEWPGGATGSRGGGWWGGWGDGGARAGTYLQSPGPGLGGWQPGSACVPHTHRPLAAVGERRATGIGPRSPGLHLPCPQPLPWPGPHQRGQLLHIVHGLQPPCQLRQSSALLGLALLRAAGIAGPSLPLPWPGHGGRGLRAGARTGYPEPWQRLMEL